MLTPIQQSILTWYEAHRRSLPWRDSDDPYAVLVSEIMLQQTQVARVVPAFEAFLERFPDLATLAAAPRSDVLQAWRGLGYNRRAVALHRAAREVATRFGGSIPADLDGLRSLPGVGEYTARAILAFAFGHDSAPVDTNIRRVVSRSIAGAPVTGKALQAAADAAVPQGQGRNWSAALMDLGARYCSSRPACDHCPVASYCAWVGAGGSDPAAATDPARQSRFAGSTRYHRGRLLDALRDGAVALPVVAAAAQLDDADAAASLVAGLVRDGLAEEHEGHLRLPA